MAGPKTKEQLEQEAAEKKAQQEALSWVQWGWDNLGNVITLAFVGLLIWGLSKTQFGKDIIEWGKGVIQGIVEELPPEMAAGIGGFLKKMGIDVDTKKLETAYVDSRTADQARSELPANAGIPAEIMAIVARDEASWKKFRDMVKENNNGTYEKAFENPAVLMAFITKQPQMVREILATIKPGAENDTSKNMIATLKTMVSDPSQPYLATLLNNENHLELMTTLATIGKLPVKPEALNNLVAELGMSHGQPTPELRKLLTHALTPDAQNNFGSIMPQLAALFTSPAVIANPKAANALRDVATSINPNDITDPKTKMLLPLLKNYSAQTVQLLNALGTDKTQTFLGLVAGSDADKNEKIGQFVKANLTSFHAFAKATDGGKLLTGELGAAMQKLTSPELTPAVVATVESLAKDGKDPEKLRASLLLRDEKTGAAVKDALGNERYSSATIVVKLLTENGRQEITEFGTERLAVLTAKEPLMNKANLDLLLTFGREIGTDATNQKRSDGTFKVVHAVTEMALNQNDALFKSLDARDVSGFFSNPKNVQTLELLVRDVVIPEGMKDEKTMLGSLKNNFRSLVEVLKNEKGAQYVLDDMNGKHDGAAAIVQATDYGLSWLGLSSNQVVFDNKPALDALKGLFPKPAQSQPAAAR